MKVAIIGGGGLVGSCAGFALQARGRVREIALIDANAAAAEGHALDILHGGPLIADQIVSAGGMEHIPDADVICITAGLRRKPEESRLDLINRNTDLFISILGDIQKAGVKSSAVVLVVSNPVDILTYVAAQRLKLPATQVIGLGTQLDTIRFRSLLAKELQAPPTQVSALILGEHGDSMVPIWSSATVAGLPLDKHPRFTSKLGDDVFTRTKGSGAEVISKKGGAGFAVGVAIADVIDSIALDSRRVLPVSSVQNGCYGLREIAISTPTLVGRSGVLAHQEFELWPKEVQALRKSGQVLRQTLDTVLQRIGK